MCDFALKLGFFKLTVKAIHQAKMVRTVSVSFLAVLIFAFFFQSSWAQHQSTNDNDLAKLAVELATRIENENLVLSPPKSIDEININGMAAETKLTKLRQLSTDAAFDRNDLPDIAISELYRDEAIKQNSGRDIDVSTILQLSAALGQTDSTSSESARIIQKIQSFEKNSDWFVAHRASLVSVNFLLNTEIYDIALKDAIAALKLIPNDLSTLSYEAQYETYDLISYTQLLLNNIELGVNTTAQVIKKGIDHNRSIDGISLINNMNYSFNSWHEYDTAEKLAETLFRLSQKSGPEINSLAYFRYGQAQNNAGHYIEALKALDKAKAHANFSWLKSSVELARAVSFGGLGDIKNAEKSLQEYELMRAPESPVIAEDEAIKLRVRALLATSQNDALSSLKLQDERLKSIVQLQLSRQAKGIQSLQANLENDKNRVAEREAALMRETELKQSELEAKQRSNVFLMALAASLLLIAICAVGFAIWRQKISKILEIAAHDAQAGDRAKSQFLSVMSHELRTPLNGIIGIAGILSEKGETKELRNYNKLILKSGENLLELLSGILDMAQMESGKLSIVTAPTSIRQIVDGLYQHAKADVDASKIQFTCFVSDNIPDDLMLDSIRVKQALSNLISNAARFTEKGRIHIHTTMSEPDRKGVRNLTMIVADTGRGITEDTKAKLFKPFAQADSSLTRTHDGAGIGLAVTRGLSRLMGGDVTMTSTAGRGSEFTMVVKTCVAREAEIDPTTNRPVFEVIPSVSTKIDFSPAVSIEKLKADEEIKEKARIKQDLYGKTVALEALPEQKSVAKETDFDEDPDVEFETISEDRLDGISPSTEFETHINPTIQNPRAGFSRSQPRSDTSEIEPDQLEGLNILIVEDIAANLEVLCSLLEPVGCSINSAGNGQEALEMMKTQSFDAVLMDIRMPIMDGIEATKAIRNLPAPQCNIAIIALTADASAENNAECLAAGADVFLTKPVIVSELFSSIRFARRKQFRQVKQALSA